MNGDGLDDILGASLYWPPQNVGIPIQILLNNGNGGFFDGTAQVINGPVQQQSIRGRSFSRILTLMGNSMSSLPIPDTTSLPFQAHRTRCCCQHRTAATSMPQPTCHSASISPTRAAPPTSTEVVASPSMPAISTAN